MIRYLPNDFRDEVPRSHGVGNGLEHHGTGAFEQKCGTKLLNGVIIMVVTVTVVLQAVTASTIPPVVIVRSMPGRADSDESPQPGDRRSEGMRTNADHVAETPLGSRNHRAHPA
jgi:hypothetical protein